MCDWWVPILSGAAAGLLVSLVQIQRDIGRLRRQRDEYTKLRALAEHIAEHPDPYANWPVYHLAAEVAALPREMLR